MTERELHNSERINIHEQGGLTTQHWEILSRVTTKKSKAREFAKAVLNGCIDPSNFRHREYLGSRHWIEVVKSLKPFKKGVNHFLVRKLNPAKYQLVQELEVFADKERSLSYTLDDYIARLGLNINVIWGTLKWSKMDKIWETYFQFAKITKSGKARYRWYREGPTPPDVILNSWLLSENECLDPKHTAPDILLEKLLLVAAQNPREVQIRLKNRLHLSTISPLFGFQTVGLLEKEI